MKIKKLKYMPYASAHTETDKEGNIYLFSYRTLVAGVVDNWAFCNGTYSATTRRHIGAFAKEISDKFGTYIDYHTFKSLYEQDLVMNVTTGEIEDRA